VIKGSLQAGSYRIGYLPAELACPASTTGMWEYELLQEILMPSGRVVPGKLMAQNWYKWEMYLLPKPSYSKKTETEYEHT